MQLHLSVIVPIYGPSTRLEALLSRLETQTLAPEGFEVIVVDDGSPEPVAIDTTAFGFQLKLIRQENTGPGGARNRALRECSAPLVLILNDDALPAPDLLETHLRLHSEAPPKTSVLGSFGFSERALESPFVQVLAESDLLFEFTQLRSREFYGWGFFWTCNLSLPLAALQELGGFDADNFREPVMEDVELGYRLEQRGWRVWYREEARCEHDHVLTPDSYFRRMQRYGANMSRMWRKHGDSTILGVAHGSQVENELQQLQLRYEALRPTLETVRQRLERVERKWRGRRVPKQLLDDVRSVLRAVRIVPIARGVAEEMTGRDPEEVALGGPRSAELTSVIFASKDALPKTRACLEALRAAHDPDFPTEIIAVDNGSQDGSADYLAEQPDVQLIRNAENEGAPHARNQAILKASGRWIVFMDNDVMVYPGWLERLRRHAEIDPRVGCVIPVSDRAAHGQQIECPAELDDAGLAALASARARDFEGRAQYKQIFSSLCVLVRRAVIDRIGGFDERFSPWGFEDDDFSVRTLLAGFRSRMALDVFVHHAHYGGRKAGKHQELLVRNWRRFADKWGEREMPSYGDYAFLNATLAREWPENALHVPLETGNS